MSDAALHNHTAAFFALGKPARWWIEHTPFFSETKGAVLHKFDFDTNVTKKPHSRQSPISVVGSSFRHT